MHGAAGSAHASVSRHDDDLCPNFDELCVCAVSVFERKHFTVRLCVKIDFVLLIY